MTILSNNGNNSKKKDKEKDQKSGNVSGLTSGNSGSSTLITTNCANRSNRSPSTTHSSLALNSSSLTNPSSSSSVVVELEPIQEKSTCNEVAMPNTSLNNNNNKRKIRTISPTSFTNMRRPKASKSNTCMTSSGGGVGCMSSSSDESTCSPVNSEDEYENRNASNEIEYSEELELTFCRNLKDKRGFIIKSMKEDGACLFRAVADHIYGDEEMHSIVRNHCMDYIAKNNDYFKQYITEDLDRYIRRKRRDNCHGNHIEIIALAEIYNRPIEVYEYATEPKNTFQSGYQTDNDPIRLSYHGRNHYNSVVDPYKATIGVGLGLPSFVPGLAEKNLMSDAIQKSEELHIEKAMLDDKLKATDWEATNDEIMDMVARESYVQWLKDNEKRQNSPRSTIASCSNWHKQSPKATTSHLITNNQQQACTSSSLSQQDLANNTKESKSNRNSPRALLPQTTATTSTSQLNNQQYYANVDDWEYTSNDILLQVMAQSQQEYLDNLRNQQSAVFTEIKGDASTREVKKKETK